MTKEEILEKSRNENQNKDFADLEVQSIATTVAYYVSFGLCAAASILSFVFTKKVNAAIWMIFFGMLSTAFIVKFAKLKKRHELFVSICYVLCFALSTVAYVFQLLGKF